MTPQLNLISGWISILLGILVGAIIGLFFHKNDWMGGYGSWVRRMMRLGHIAFFGMAILNILFSLSLSSGFKEVNTLSALVQVGSLAWFVALLTMPLLCFLSAAYKPFRHLFFIPVVASIIGTVSMIVVIV